MGKQWRGAGDWAFGLPRAIGDVPAGGEMLPPFRAKTAAQAQVRPDLLQVLRADAEGLPAGPVGQVPQGLAARRLPTAAAKHGRLNDQRDQAPHRGRGVRHSQCVCGARCAIREPVVESAGVPLRGRLCHSQHRVKEGGDPMPIREVTAWSD